MPDLNPNLPAVWRRLRRPDYTKTVGAEAICRVSGGAQQQPAISRAIDREMAVCDAENMSRSVLIDRDRRLSLNLPNEPRDCVSKYRP